MDPRTIITLLLCILGGLATNLIYISVFKFLFSEIYENILRLHGLNGLKLRVAIAILLIDLPGTVRGILTPSLSNDDLILSGICASSAFFALLMLFKSLARSRGNQLQK